MSKHSERGKALGWSLLAIVSLGTLALALLFWFNPRSPSAEFQSDLDQLAPSDRVSFVTHFQQGLELARRSQAPRALAEFERCLALIPDHAEALFHKARLLLRTGPVSSGLVLLERLSKYGPLELRARLLLADLYGRQGPHLNADRAAEMQRLIRAACGGLYDFDQQVRQWLQSETSQSPSMQLIRNPARFGNPTDSSPLARLGHAYSRRFDMGFPATNFEANRNRNFEVDQECRQLLDEYRGLAGISAEHGRWLMLSQVRFDLAGDDHGPPMNSSIVLDLAQQYFERTLDTSMLDSTVAHYGLLGLGHVARDMGNFVEASQLYTLLLQQPGLFEGFRYQAQFNLGLVAYRSGDTMKARAHWRWCATKGSTPLLAWLLSVVGEAPLTLRTEEVSAEHRRTLKFTDQAQQLGVDKLDGAGPSAWYDVDLDGDLDLFVSGCDTFSILYRNDGDRFIDISQAAGLLNVASGFSATFADYDNDGDGDLYIGRNGWSGPARNSLFRNRGDGTFEDVTDQAGVGHPGSSFVHGWSDFDRDGFLDLFIANGITNDGSNNVLYHNNGDGTFVDSTAKCGLAEQPGIATIGFAIGDYDRDGWPDLFVNSWKTRNRLYHNQGDGTFEELASAAGVDGRDHPNSGYVAFMADFDNDAWPDILLTKLAPFPMVISGMVQGYRPTSQFTDFATKYYRNQGDGTFVDESEAAGLDSTHGTMGANVLDVNNDGYLDFYLGTGDPGMARLEPNAFYLNDSGYRFINLTRFTGLGHLGKGHGITSADFDFDGDLDIYAPQGGFVHGDLWNNALYVNELGNLNHWLAVQLEGVTSNRMAVGARLTLKAGDFVVYREQTAGGAFGSSSSPFVHFGLGDHTSIDALEIDCPSGERGVYAAVPVDRFISIVESRPTVTELKPQVKSGPR